MFRIEKETVINLVHKLIETKIEAFIKYDVHLRNKKFHYFYKNIHGITDYARQDHNVYTLLLNGVTVYHRENNKQVFNSLKIDKSNGMEIFVEPVMDLKSKNMLSYVKTIKIWTRFLLFPYYVSVSEFEELFYPTYRITYGIKDSIKNEYVITLDEYTAILSMYARTVIDNNRQKNSNKELMAFRANDVLLIELLDANKIEKKIC